MSEFKRWLKRRMAEGIGDFGSPADAYRMNGGGSQAVDHDSAVRELLDTLHERYREQLMAFATDIAKRGDQEISELLAKVQTGMAPQRGADRRFGPQDEIVPPSADTGSAGEV